MKVVLVVPGGVDRSGTERVIPALLWFIERVAVEHQVTVVALGHEPVASRWPLLGAEVINVRPIGPGPARFATAMRRVVRACTTNGLPDVIHGFWASATGLGAVLAGKRLGVPTVVSAAGGEIAALPEIGYGGALGRGGRMIADRALRGATAVTASSGWMADHIRARGYRVDEVIALGVDRALFCPDRSVPVVPGRLVHVASRNRVKDPFMLLEAFRQVLVRQPHCTLEMIGVDTLDGAVEQRAAQLGIESAVIIRDYVPYHELPRHYIGAELHVLSSLHDAAPVVVLEAAACGVTTVGTRVGHVTDLAALSPPGAVAVAAGDPGALAEAIVRTLNDDNARRTLNEAARNWSIAHDADYTAHAFIGLYQRLTSKKRVTD